MFSSIHALALPLAFATAMLPAPAQAQTDSSAPTLTLDQVLARVALANPDLAAARHQHQSVEGELQQARLRPNPTLDVSVEDTRRQSRETTVQLSQPIELGDKRARRIVVAEKALDGAAIALQARWTDLRADVTKAYYETLLAERRQALARTAVTNAERTSSSASKRVTAGKISPVEETRARVAATSVRLQVLQADAELATARRQLASFWHGGTAPFTLLADPLDTLPDLPELASLMAQIDTSPTLSRARSAVEQRQASSRLERSKQVPDMAVIVGLKRSEELGRNQAIIGLSLPLPLFDRNQGNLLAALRRTDQARDELVAATINVQTELARAHAALALARAEVEALRSAILPGAQQAFDAATTGFDYGKFAFLDVLDAQRTLLQTQAQYLRALGDAHRAAADIERLVGSAPTPPIE